MSYMDCQCMASPNYVKNYLNIDTLFPSVFVCLHIAAAAAVA